MLTYHQAFQTAQDYLHYFSGEDIRTLAVYPTKELQKAYDLARKKGEENSFVKIHRPKAVRKVKMNYQFVIDESQVLESQQAWGFVWNSSDYFKTGMKIHDIKGNGLVIVDKISGQLYQAPKFRSYTYIMDAYEGLVPTKYFTWNSCLRIKKDGHWIPINIKGNRGGGLAGVAV